MTGGAARRSSPDQHDGAAGHPTGPEQHPAPGPGAGLSGRTTPRVSVVLPVFNGEAFLAAALASVLGQTLEDLELIVVDDGSTDATPAIVQEFAADKRLVHHVQERQGIVGALNAGLALATAPWIARMDADDVMRPERLSRQLAFLESHPELSGAASDYELIDEEGRPWGAVHSPLVTVEAVEAYVRRGLPVVFAHPTMIVSAQAVAELGGYRAEYRDSEDVDLFTRLLDSGRRLVVQPEVLLSLRVHGSSVSAGAGRRQLMLNDLIVLNSRRRRARLPEITVAEHAASHRGTPRAALDFERRLVRARLLRRATVHRRAGRRLAHLATVLLALGVGPGRAVSAIVRRARSEAVRRRR